MQQTKILLCFVVLFCSLSLHSQEADTIKTKTGFQKAGTVAGIAVPALMITYGALSFETPAIREIDYRTRRKLYEGNYLLYHKLDDYSQYSPAVAAFTMKLAGVESKHKLPEMAILYTLSNAVMIGAVTPTKKLTHRTRPDSSTDNSFPSGHTATAFVAAEFLHQEYGEKSVWISVGGYTMATLIGVSRVFNNRHWVSDVVAGGGIGILSTKAVYWLYPHLRKIVVKDNTAVLFPTYQNGNFGVYFALNF